MSDPALRIETPALTRAGAPRLDAIDLMRGLVIALMVLDHTRDYLHMPGFDATDTAKAGAILFATRWVTHLCAPTFVFLAGVSIHLQKLNGKTGWPLAGFLVSRGLWLIALELTVIVFAFNFAWPFVFLQVIWAIGVSMIAFALLSRLPWPVVLALGAAIVAGHGLVDAVPAARFGAFAPLWTVLMAPGPAPFGTGFVAYPAVPWLGVMCLGFGLTPFLFGGGRAHFGRLALLGLAFLAAFAALRGYNHYGDPRPWVVRAEGWRTALSFMNVSKYPPSLDYVLATLGVSFLLFPLVARLGGPIRTVLAAFGRTAFFTYLIHIFVVHAAAMGIAAVFGVSPSVYVGYVADTSRLAATGWSLPLPWVYVVWLAVLALLFPLSRWFEGVKRTRRDRWLSYL